MKVLVMAAGSVGGYFGGLLAKAGNDVLFVARGENLAAINGNGLIVESETVGNFTVETKAVERPDGSWVADLVLFCVKSYHNSVAMDTIAPAVGEETAILTLQNGVGSGDELSAVFGANRVMLGAAYVEAAHPAPGCSVRLAGKAASSSPSRMGVLRNAVPRLSRPLPTQASTPRSRMTSNRRCGTSWSTSAASAA